MPLQRPAQNEFHAFYQSYVEHVPDGEILELLETQMNDLRNLFKSVSDDDSGVAHPPYTWTLKQLVGHLIDAEKIFGCRAHRFACGDLQPVPGMEQNGYVDALDYDQIRLSELVDEWEFTRRSNLGFLRRIPRPAFDRVGVADENPVTVRALAYIMYGHVAYHLRIVRRRLGLAEVN